MWKQMANHLAIPLLNSVLFQEYKYYLWDQNYSVIFISKSFGHFFPVTNILLPAWSKAIPFKTSVSGFRSLSRENAFEINVGYNFTCDRIYTGYEISHPYVGPDLSINIFQFVKRINLLLIIIYLYS